MSLGSFKFIDLCSGTGAFNIVLSKYGAECVFSNDYDKSSEKINNSNKLCDNFVYGDINILVLNKIPAHDILTAGFPCQPFSIAGERKGFEDIRSNVFKTILHILKIHKPKIIILENVKNLKTINNKQDYNLIKNSLIDLKYFIVDNILNTSLISGIPQNRERLYIIGFLDINIYNNFDLNFPLVNKKNISDFLEKDIPDKYYYTNKYKIYNLLLEYVTEHISKNIVYQYRRTLVRQNKNNNVPTLTANCGTGGHNVPIILDNKGIRKLTPRECFNLQGFPSNYILPTDLSDGKLYKLAGNSITINVLELIIKKIIYAINS
jgi:DNA (cytosine-5)-methyltransferase 1